MKVFFPGSFDPLTDGHVNLIYRAVKFADKVVIGIGTNSDKKCMFTVEQRLEAIKERFAEDPWIEVVTYSGLTAEAAADNGCDAILRGVRDAVDYSYEQNIANINRRINGIETIMLFTLPELQHVSSSLSRELYKHTGILRYSIPQFEKYLENGK